MKPRQRKVDRLGVDGAVWLTVGGEPFAALDKGLRRQLREDLVSLQDELKIPMLLITHDDDDVSALADEVVQLRAGRIASDAAVFA